MRAARTFLAMTLALGCSSPREVDPTTQVREPILGGQISNAGTDDDAVLLLRATAEGEVLCTATLVAPNLALTARHCVAHSGPPLFQCTEKGELVPNGWEGGTLGADFPPETISLFSVDERDEPAAIVSAIVSSNTDTICKNDIAYLVLDRNVNLPVRSIRSERTTAPHETVTLVGFGATTTGQKLDYLEVNRKRLTGRDIVDVGPDSESDPIVDAPPRSLLLHGPASCVGDSGGPAFSEETGAIIGVFSILSDIDCSASNLELLYTHTSPFSALTEDAFDAAGATPVPEPTIEDDAGTDAGAGPEPTEDAGPTPPPTDASANGDGGCQLGKRPVDGSFLLLCAGAIALTRRRPRKDSK